MASQGQGIAIIAGQGNLPKELAQHLLEQNPLVVIVQFQGVLLDWCDGYTVIPAQFEKPNALFKSLKRLGIDQVVFAGAMTRPKLNPLKFDLTLLKLAPTLLPSLKSGDNTTLSLVIKIFEDNGFTILGAHEVLPNLVASKGILTKQSPTEADKQDTERAFGIITAMSAADVGQACVVAQGLCLGVETIQGSDVMLTWVAQSAGAYRHDPNGGQGVFVKLPKAGQDLRVDLPTIGPNTIHAVHNAGLAGIVISQGSVMILDQDECISLANEYGLFIWVKEL